VKRRCAFLGLQARAPTLGFPALGVSDSHGLRVVAGVVTRLRRLGSSGTWDQAPLAAGSWSGRSGEQPRIRRG
jgi:hypothetical protein